ncbi:Cache 3/Cache 2 fusion domain-containing protein [Crassaminicella profunda]|uniref:Cache 3/Cache 2 fusion domain-containing protein n=1 Tax=Crassaminicella profunda TaxID=1286698 RepID=UPI001CA69502|nr:Cache 3/Cache 2 fusion domain-containing protein [Crassaminicella profunda]QZY55188.1 Cache 3/Cache 2 fusion domain-containing protein [Crassaminicella profunda]
MSIKSKLIISYVLLIVFSVGILGFLIGNHSRSAVFREVTEKSKGTVELIHNMVSVRNNLLSEKVCTDLHYVEELLNNLGEIRMDYNKEVQVGNYTLPPLYAGNTNLTLDTALADKIKKSIGAIYSIFLLQDDQLIRVSTNLEITGNRAIGTKLSSDHYSNNDCNINNCNIYKKIINNKTYYGSHLIGDDWLITGYKPLLDKDKKVIGAIALGYKGINSYLEKTLNDIKIGKTGYVYVMNSKGDVLVHPNIKGENLSSFAFSQKIIKTKNGIIEYEFQGVSKMASYKYFAPWDLYIIATANYDDLKSSSISIFKTTLFIGIFISLICVIVSLFVANTLVQPINKLKNYMESVSQGDLTVYSDIESKDEIGILSNSFNHMVEENKRLLQEIINHDHMKTEFFSNISHELKTPINMILSTSQLFSFYAKNEQPAITSNKLTHHINIINQNCYRLLRLVNNLIDITKIDSGYMKLNLKNENLIEVVENITLSTVEYVESKGRILIFDTDTEEKFMAFDEEKIERIMLNLISNAVKFTRPKDTIQINVYDKKDKIDISIKDTGIGIPEDKVEKIFERFKQVDPLLNRSHEGSGIGLSLVKSLVEMHNGSISVKSTYNKGTEFIVTLPVKFVPEENTPSQKDDFSKKTNVEKIKIEFSDIYS